MNRAVRKLVAVAIALLAIPAAAEAHLTGTGLGPFYAGVTHFFLSPEEFVPVLALALFAGLRGKYTGRFALFLLPAGWFAGGLIGLARPVDGQFTLLTCASFLLLGALVASDAKLQPRFVAVLAVAVGLVLGFLDGSGMSQVRLGVLGLLGSVASLFVLVALAVALVASLRVPWTRIVVRVAGSWIAAAGLLLFGWALHERFPKMRSESPALQQNLMASTQPRSWNGVLPQSCWCRGVTRTLDKARRGSCQRAKNDKNSEPCGAKPGTLLGSPTTSACN